MILLITSSSSQLALAADTALALQDDFLGKYDVVAAGVGLFGVTSGTIEDFEIPGTSTVVMAYLFWAGFDYPLTGDDEVTLTVGASVYTITADETYSHAWPNSGGKDHFVYVADVTSEVEVGIHDYIISDVTMDTNYGVGLMVVYEDDSLPYSLIKIHYGLDSLHFAFTDPNGPNSEVTSVEFDPSIYERDMDIILIAGGVMHDDRPNAIWYETGTGSLPTDIITGTPTPTDPPYPLGAYDGGEWDTYEETIPIPSNDEWLCIQIESIPEAGTGFPDYDGRGASALFLAAGFKLPYAAIGDYVWEDTDKDGIQEGGEPGIPGVTVNLLDCSDTVLDSTTTDADGLYLFIVPPGDYKIEFIAPSGYDFSPKDQGADDAIDSDADPTTGKTTCTTLDPEEIDLTWDAGLYQQPPTNPGTGTPGYWKNHPEAWPVDSISICGTDWTIAQAIEWMNTPVKGDKTITMFAALVSAKLNVLIGNDDSCIADTIDSADAWMCEYGPVGSGVRARSDAWQNEGEDLYSMLDDYNNGLLCAPSRD